MHAMIDLETLSLRPDACILSVACVGFELRESIVHRHQALHLHILINSQPGRHIDGETLQFWLGQEGPARWQVVEGQRTEGTYLVEALLRLKDWWRTHQPECAWSHGAAFDIPILEHAFRKQRLSPPWGHRDPRDTRTLFMLAPGEDAGKGMEGPHNALEDAVLQAERVQAAYRRLRGAMLP